MTWRARSEPWRLLDATALPALGRPHSPNAPEHPLKPILAQGTSALALGRRSSPPSRQLYLPAAFLFSVLIAFISALASGSPSRSDPASQPCSRPGSWQGPWRTKGHCKDVHGHGVFIAQDLSSKTLLADPVFSSASSSGLPHGASVRSAQSRSRSRNFKAAKSAAQSASLSSRGLLRVIVKR